MPAVLSDGGGQTVGSPRRASRPVGTKLDYGQLIDYLKSLEPRRQVVWALGPDRTVPLFALIGEARGVEVRDASIWGGEQDQAAAMVVIGESSFWLRPWLFHYAAVLPPLDLGQQPGGFTETAQLIINLRNGIQIVVQEEPPEDD